MTRLNSLPYFFYRHILILSFSLKTKTVDYYQDSTILKLVFLPISQFFPESPLKH